jgi:glycerophosphoryl diester phosphodiesterase
MLALALTIWIGLEPRVSLMEALHVAERRTGAAAAEWAVTDSEGAAQYRIRMTNGHLFWIDARHGRLNRIEPGVYRWPGVKVVAHRGGALLGPPENTIQAFEKAIAIGADVIELDIRQTRDGRLVIMHDPTVDRTTNGKGRVAEMSYESIRALKPPVPSLAEALAAMKGRIDADLDFKEGDLALLVRTVREAGMVEHCSFAGTETQYERLRELEPGIRIRPGFAHPGQIPDVFRRFRPPLVGVSWRGLTEDSIRQIHLGGAEAFVHTLGAADQLSYIRLAAEAGADYIQTDQPDRAIALLEEMGLRKR